MNNLVRRMCLILAMLMLLLACSCASNDANDAKGNRELRIREAISLGTVMEKNGSTIGGERIDSTKSKIESIEFIADDKAVVRGVMYMTDIYDVTYSSDFSCVVRSKDGGTTWEIPLDFEYFGWTKIG